MTPHDRQQPRRGRHHRGGAPAHQRTSRPGRAPSGRGRPDRPGSSPGRRPGPPRGRGPCRCRGSRSRSPGTAPASPGMHRHHKSHLVLEPARAGPCGQSSRPHAPLSRSWAPVGSHRTPNRQFTRSSPRRRRQRRQRRHHRRPCRPHRQCRRKLLPSPSRASLNTSQPVTVTVTERQPVWWSTWWSTSALVGAAASASSSAGTRPAGGPSIAHRDTEAWPTPRRPARTVWLTPALSMSARSCRPVSIGGGGALSGGPARSTRRR